ncbi:MAG: hypothetical protein K6C35_02235 [Eubacterium sp.]|nr:hypothetical protein [Eubacterium sp.]
MINRKKEEGRAEKLIEELIHDVSEAQNMPLSQGKVVINKDEFIEKLENLDSILRTEINVYREITDKRAKIITDAEKEAENIIYEAERNASRIRVSKRRKDEVLPFKVSDLTKDDKEALRTANDIYAASLIYTDEMLTEVDHLINNAYEIIQLEYEKVIHTLKQKISNISSNKNELMNNLSELSKNDRYSQILELSQLLSNEIYVEKAKEKAREEEALTQLRINFDEDTAFKEEEKEKPVINPDRTQVKIKVKKAETDDIRKIKAKKVNKNA